MRSTTPPTRHLARRHAPAPRTVRAAAALGGLGLALAATGCDKTRALAAERAKRGEPEAPAGPRLDLAARPPILFQVFGERSDARMIPVGAIVDRTLVGIELDRAGWERFDSLYTRSPATVTLYQDGRALGEAAVRQGMWEKPDEPLYSLPNCRLLVPLAAVTIPERVKTGYTVELFASTAALRRHEPAAAMAPAVATRAAREVAYGVGERAGIQPSALDSLDFRAVAVHTGATAQPTLVAAFIGHGAADESEGTGTARHVFAIADRAGDRYASTFTHAVNGPAATAVYRRYVDHLDIDGDGIDEILLEGWQSGGDSYLMALGYRNGRWEEVFRGRSNWCLDRR